jgi:hypothetical protein
VLFRGGAFRGGAFRGGAFRGAAFRGGAFRGGAFRGIGFGLFTTFVVSSIIFVASFFNEFICF